MKPHLVILHQLERTADNFGSCAAVAPDRPGNKDADVMLNK